VETHLVFRLRNAKRKRQRYFCEESQQVMPKAPQVCAHAAVQLHGSAGRECGSVFGGTAPSQPAIALASKGEMDEDLQ
jgi:hypothetical protein